MTQTPPTKLYAAADKTVTIVCPWCAKTTKEQAEKYQNQEGPVRIECSCGKAFEVQIENRKAHRKNLYIYGLYVRSAPQGGWGKMVLKNLSIGGVGFETETSRHGLEPGDIVKVEFTLDDGRNTLIRRQSVVRTAEGSYIGCQFMKSTNTIDPDIGFYMKNR